MTVEQIAEVDPQMANHLRIRDEIKLQIESFEVKGLQPDSAAMRTLTDTLAIRERLITERSDFFRSKYKGFSSRPAKPR